jgi:non-haem Fe2+, alpha-ketoglutarate-dependent halogenase
MGRLLSPERIDRYRRDGYLSPLVAFDASQARVYRDRLEDCERRFGLAHERRRKMHLYLTWVDEIVRHPRVLDAVEDLIGPDILVYHLTLWMKEPRTDAFVSWHQDSTYFGLEPPHEHVTAWVALTTSDLRSGCVQVVPGSHHKGQVQHDVAKSDANMFPTGQNLEVSDAMPVDTMVLAPGEFSLHHTYLFHNSMPNRSDDRRIGLGISYIPTRCRCVAGQRLTASLVRGVDRYGHFDLDPAPAADCDASALAVHGEAMRRWQAARDELIPRAHGVAA